MTKSINLKKLKITPISDIGSIKLPTLCGIYIFFDNNKNILYIGKSKNLKNRLGSYFQSRLYGKTKNMMRKAKYLSFITVNSEIESLILEANLIRREKPQYNLELKDDKRPLYIKITKEKYPRVLTARKIENDKSIQNIYGPFPSSKNVNNVLKIVRKIFPYSTHRLGKKACLRSQIGLCDPCPNDIENSPDRLKYVLRKKYLKNIKYVKKFLDGDFVKIKYLLKKDLDEQSKNENYEKALETKNKLEQINYITQPIIDTDEYIKNPNHLTDIKKRELKNLSNILGKYFRNISEIKRIECYDVAHIQGSFPTASMVTFINGFPETSLYRRFKILQEKKQSDTDSLNEVAKRRQKHLIDWGVPDLMIIDGGKGQVSSFLKVFTNTIPIVGVAKREETLVIPVYESTVDIHYIEEKLKEEALYIVQKLRNEAHRFARSYHHKLIEKELFSKIN